jgi:phosphoribosyl 1,2-cyclic phosphodiesterase
MALSQSGEAFAFIDAGTAIDAYSDHGLALAQKVSVFLTHYHWDHIQGLSMLGEMWKGHCRMDIYGADSPEDTLTRAISPPWFPVSLADQTNLTFKGVVDPVEVASITVTAFGVNHPQGAVGYRLDGPTSALAVITDHETTLDWAPHLMAVAQGVETVIYDAQYLPSEIPSHIGWGHSTWEDAVEFAAELGAERLILTSHDPHRTDDEIDAITAAARERFPNTEAAVPGSTVAL